MGNGKSDNPIIVVQGAQYGSEAKGAVAAALCIERVIDVAIRTGTVNAGHTVYYEGEPYKMQQLPTAWVNPGTTLVIGPGAYVHPDILHRELEGINKVMGYDLRKTVKIDFRCGLHLPLHTERSAKSGRHHSMGATGKGCSEAVIDKIVNRGRTGDRTFADFLEHWDLNDYPLFKGLELYDTASYLNGMWEQGAKLLIEGTQGTMLDLHIGPYPYTTHKQTLVGNWLSEAGLSPNIPLEIALVARTYPIRVAGNSGPMPSEISWVELARKINKRLEMAGLPPRVQEQSIEYYLDALRDAARVEFKPVDGFENPEDLLNIERWPQHLRERYPKYVSELHATAFRMLPDALAHDLQKVFEFTTVTKKLRRVAELHVETLLYSVMLNRPDYLVLTFANYLEPSAWDKDWNEMPHDAAEEIRDFSRALGEDLGIPVRYVSTGAETEYVLEIS